MKANSIIKKLLGEDDQNVQPDLVSVSCDFKNPDELIEELLKVLPTLGLHAIEDPTLGGSDQLGILISKNPITPDTIKKYRQELGIPDDEEDAE